MVDDIGDGDGGDVNHDGDDNHGGDDGGDGDGSGCVVVVEPVLL